MTGANPNDSFGSNPDKKYIGPEDGDATIVDNVDIRNAIYLRFIEGLGERVVELAEEIQESIDWEANRPIEIPLGRVGTGLFELHTVTISFFESSSWILSNWAFQVEVQHS